MSKTPLRVQVRDAVATLTLDRPAARNAVDADLLAALESAVFALCDRRAQDPPVRALLLRGAGEKAFCAGGDLDWFASLSSADAQDASERMTRVLDALHDAPFPVVAALAGDAYGGGLEILSVADLRLARAGIRLAFRQVAMGTVTGWGGAARWFSRLPADTILPLVLEAEPLDAEAARSRGLLHEVVPAADLDARARELTARLAAHPVEAVQAFLAMARAARAGDLPHVREIERDRFRELWNGPVFRERLAAWRARRG